MKKIIILISVLVVNAILLIQSFTYVNTAQYKEIKTVSYANINYDSRSKDPGVAFVKQFLEKDSATIKEIAVNFNMVVYSTENAGIFQTAPLNSGLRMEIDQASALNLIIRSKDGNFQTLKLVDRVELNKTYRLRINLNRESKLSINVNEGRGDAVLNNIDYAISEILVGTGYDKSLNFDGRLSDFSVDYKLFNRVPSLLQNFIGMLLFISFMYFLFLAFKEWSGPSPEISKENKIESLGLIILIGFGVAILFHYYMAFYMNKPYPFNTFLFFPTNNSNDFYNTVVFGNKALSLPPSYTRNYFPFLNLIISLFSLIKPHVLSFYIFSTIFILYLLRYNQLNLSIGRKQSDIKNILIFTFLTYPVLFSLERGNFELILFIFLSLFVYYYKAGKTFLSILFLSMSIAMKLYPAVFLVLLVADKRYKEVLYAIFTTLLLSAGSMLFLDGDFFGNITRMLQSQKLYTEMYALGDAGLDHGHSIFGVFKAVIYYLKINVDIRQLLTVYVAGVAAVFVALTIFILRFKIKFWQKIGLLIFAMALLPHVSNNYKLLHIFIPIYLFINTGEKERYGYAYIFLFGLLLIPKNYRVFDNLYAGVIFDPVIILLLSALIIIEAVKNKKTLLQPENK